MAPPRSSESSGLDIGAFLHPRRRKPYWVVQDRYEGMPTWMGEYVHPFESLADARAKVEREKVSDQKAARAGVTPREYRIVKRTPGRLGVKSEVVDE